jgi:hypothetical protein
MSDPFERLGERDSEPDLELFTDQLNPCKALAQEAAEEFTEDGSIRCPGCYDPESNTNLRYGYIANGDSDYAVPCSECGGPSEPEVEYD